MEKCPPELVGQGWMENWKIGKMDKGRFGG